MQLLVYTVTKKSNSTSVIYCGTKWTTPFRGKSIETMTLRGNNIQLRDCTMS